MGDTNTRCHHCHRATLAPQANCQIAMAAHRLELPPCPQSLATAFKKSSLPRSVLRPRWTCGSMWQLGKWWYARDGCVWGRVSSRGRALGKWGLSHGGGGHSPDCQTASLQPQLPRIQRLAGSQGQHSTARNCSQLTDHTLVAHRLKQAQGQDRIPFVTD